MAVLSYTFYPTIKKLPVLPAASYYQNSGCYLHRMFTSRGADKLQYHFKDGYDDARLFQGLEWLFQGLEWLFEGLEWNSKDLDQLVYSDWICYTKIHSMAAVTNSTSLHCCVDENE